MDDRPGRRRWPPAGATLPVVALRRQQQRRVRRPAARRAVAAAWLLILASALGAASSEPEAPAAAGCAGVLPPDLLRICERGELRVGRYDGERPPFFTRRPEGWVGFDVDLARDLAARLGVRYREDATAPSFDAVVDRVADGTVDLGISKLSGTLARARKVRFSKPYLTVYQALLVNRLSLGGGEDAFRALNAPGFTIGALEGTAYVGYVRESLAAAEARPYADFGRMIADVVAGDIDAALIDSARADTWRRTHREQLIHVRTRVDRRRSDPLAIAVAWDNTHLLAWVNLYLDNIRADGTAERLYHRWFGGAEMAEP